MRDLLKTSRYRGLTVVLLVCALAMRMMIPSGFMIAPSAHGATLILCPDQGSVPVAMTHKMGAMAMPGHDMGKHGGDHQGKGADHPCAFASAGAAADLVSIVHPAAPLIRADFASALFGVSAQPGLGLAAPPPPKTGPPIFV